MTWVKIDDRIAENPKILMVGVEARWTYVAGLAYCARHLTDGFIPRGALSFLGDEQLQPERVLEAATELLEVGLWEERGALGFEVHDYLEYNPTKAEVMKARATRREIARAGGRARAAAAGRAAGGRFTPVENAVENGGQPAGAPAGRPAGEPAEQLGDQPPGWESTSREASRSSSRETSPVPVPVVPGYSSSGSSSFVPTGEAQEPPISTPELEAALEDDGLEGIDPTTAHLVRKKRRRSPAFAEAISPNHLARIQAELGAAVLREAMIAVDAHDGTVEHWPSYLDAIARRVTEDIAQWELKKPRPPTEEDNRQ